MLLDLFKLMLGLMAAGAIAGGLFFLLSPERVRRWRLSRNYYDEHYKTREEIADKGLKLLTLGAALVAVLYTGLNYERSSKEFVITRRPFVRAEPISRQGTFYRVVEGGLGPRIEFFFKVTNVGSLPAYRVALIETLKTGDLTTQGEKKEEHGVLFPGDLLGVDIPFSVIKFPKSMTSQELVRFLADKTIELELRIEYEGVVKKPKKPYHTRYKIKFLNPENYNIVDIDADNP